MARRPSARGSAALALVVPLALLAACASPAAAPQAGVTAAQQWEKLKSLAGTWKSAAGSTMEATTTFRLVGNGTTLQETLFGGTPHEMVTMYHLDGDALVLTHYCAAGNQPQMRAVPGADLSEIRFEFVRLGNGDVSKDMHMHDAVLRFGDDGRFRPVWSSWEGGKPGGFQAVMEFERVIRKLHVQGPH